MIITVTIYFYHVYVYMNAFMYILYVVYVYVKKLQLSICQMNQLPILYLPKKNDSIYYNWLFMLSPSLFIDNLL